MSKISILSAIKKLKRSIFTTREASACAGGSMSNTIQALNHLAKEEVVIKITRGVWGLDMGGGRFSQYSVIPFLLPRSRVYVSFLSALHLHGIIEQIPQSIMLASTGHTKTVRTKLGTFFFHKISPGFFKGFGWYKGEGEFLNTYNLLKRLPVSCLHVFPFSKRKGTPAALLKKQIPLRIKQERLSEVMKVQREISSVVNRSILNKEIEVIIDEKIEEKGMSLGRSRWDAPEVDGQVFIQNCRSRAGDLIKVKIIDTYEYDLVGTQII